MKTISTTLFLLLTTLTFAAGTNYEQAMGTALQQFASCQTVDDYQNAANTFERIANAETDKWLPRYYTAECYILMSFNETDKVLKDQYLDVAQKSIDLMMRTDTNSEMHALQGFLYTARLVVDPMTRGKEYMILSSQSLEKSLAINPTNPRALYLQLSNELGMARFFGNDTSMYCERIENLLQNWDAYNSSEPFYPVWGKHQVEAMARQCAPKVATDSTQNN